MTPLGTAAMEQHSDGLRGAVAAPGTVRPQPTDDEVAAIVAVLAVLEAEEATRRSAPAGSPSRWAMAGRRAAMQRMGTGSASGWGQAPGGSARR